MGARVVLDEELPLVASLFAETQSRILVSVSDANSAAFIDILTELEVPYSVLGEVGGDRLIVENAEGVILDAAVTQFADTWQTSLERQVLNQ
jgi:phosphoribosylformylglycinamidine synthase